MARLRITVRRLRNSICTALLALLAMACQGEPDDIWSPPVGGGESLLEQLRIPQQLAIRPSGAGLQASFATARGLGAGSEADLELMVTGGSIEVWSPGDDLLFIRELEVSVADVVVSPEVIGPRGAHLTGVGARLAAPVSLVPTEQDGVLTVIAHFDLEASWALVVGEDQAYPLNRLRLSDVPFSLEISRDNLGDPQVRLVGFRDGTFWTWAGALELADLTVDLFAGSPPEIEQQ